MGKMRVASYRHGVAWIAKNDEPGEVDIYVIENMISVRMLADLFGVPALRVATDVYKLKYKELKNEKPT